MDTSSQLIESRLTHMPISFFSVVMGMAGMTIAWEKAQQVFGTDLGFVNALLATLTALVFIALGVMYTQKIIKHPEQVSAELKHPVKLSFFPTISISFLLMSIAFMSDLIPRPNPSPFAANTVYSDRTTGGWFCSLYEA
ncbi:hypothetical protein [Leucothrix pacifica]|uniref:SLAC1 family transporter n=1 Tax=Leucothrix pacifica TaxID=1247513 RepID=UPI001FE31288|nr:hypothetical protein [Leucothrix pacifica]